jgi:copper(I)-binding protein
MQPRKRVFSLYAVIVAVGVACSVPATAADAIAVDEAWVRAPAPGQSVAGAYMNLTSRSGASLVAAQSADARKVELHTMSVRDGVMRMRPLERLDLPAGKTVSLKPGGHHLMLIGVKRSLAVGQRVALALTVENARGEKSVVRIDAEVRAAAGGSTGHEAHR